MRDWGSSIESLTLDWAAQWVQGHWAMYCFVSKLKAMQNPTKAGPVCIKVKAPVAKPDDLNAMPRTPQQKEKQLLHTVFWPSHPHACHRHNKKVNVIYKNSKNVPPKELFLPRKFTNQVFSKVRVGPKYCDLKTELKLSLSLHGFPQRIKSTFRWLGPIHSLRQ